MLLSIVIPAFNEEKTIISVLDKLLLLKLPQNFDKEVIIIDDCSSDNTRKIVQKYIKDKKGFSIICNKFNQGKTQSVKKAIVKTNGDYVMIQDADLEYDIQDISIILAEAVRNNIDVIYGNRFTGNNKLLYKSFYRGNKLVSFFSNIFTYPRIKMVIPDMEVCYKLVRGNIMRNIGNKITSKTSFGLEPELTARLSRYKVGNKHLKFMIVPIKYFPRSIKDGKKLRYIDGVKAVFEIIKYNLF